MTEPNGEFAHIDWIRRQASYRPEVAVGIGDDAALWQFDVPEGCLVAVDMLMEGRHFTVPPAAGAQIGRKALAVNLSDLAAMAGAPLAAVVSIACNRTHGSEFARQVHLGLKQLADEFNVSIIGGDTNVWEGPLVVSVTVLGRVTGAGPVLRSGARPGDWIMVTGRLGGSLQSGRHLAFLPRVREAQQLHAAVGLHAMIDVSDGLWADLGHILEESETGAVIDADALPLHDAAGIEDALRDGEDFELLFTVTPEAGRRLLETPPVEVLLTKIGEITAQGGCRLQSPEGHLPDELSGWEHSFA